MALEVVDGELGTFLVVVPWPRYPTVTKTGRESLAKTAGKLLPWLSMNVVNNLPSPVYRVLRGTWRDHVAKHASYGSYFGLYPAIVDIHLYRKGRSADLDTMAIIEGAKPCVDGLVQAGVLPDDKRAYVAGVEATCTRIGGADEEPRIALYVHAKGRPT